MSHESPETVARGRGKGRGRRPRNVGDRGGRRPSRGRRPRGDRAARGRRGAPPPGPTRIDVLNQRREERKTRAKVNFPPFI